MFVFLLKIWIHDMFEQQPDNIFVLSNVIRPMSLEILSQLIFVGIPCLYEITYHNKVSHRLHRLHRFFNCPAEIAEIAEIIFDG